MSTTAPSPSQPITLPQLLELVERAIGGDERLYHQLFSVFLQLQFRPETPANERALAETLQMILLNKPLPSLAELDPEDVQPVQDLLRRLNR